MHKIYNLYFKKLLTAAVNRRESMGECKAYLSMRVRQDLKDALQKSADREHRKVANLSELLMEWSFEQLEAAGSLERLLKRKVGRSGSYRKER